MKFLGVMRDTLKRFQVGFGRASTMLTKLGNLSATITPASVAAATAVEQTFTVQGLETGDVVFVSPPSILAGVSVTSARVSAANTIAITFQNSTAGALVPPAGAYRIGVMR